jgi:hypothetical protein
VLRPFPQPSRLPPGPAGGHSPSPRGRATAGRDWRLTRDLGQPRRTGQETVGSESLCPSRPDLRPGPAASSARAAAARPRGLGEWPPAGPGGSRLGCGNGRSISESLVSEITFGVQREAEVTWIGVPSRPVTVTRKEQAAVTRTAHAPLAAAGAPWMAVTREGWGE